MTQSLPFTEASLRRAIAAARKLRDAIDKSLVMIERSHDVPTRRSASGISG
jgi:hypothetical protein